MQYYQNQNKPKITGLGCGVMAALPILALIGIYLGLSYWHSISIPQYVRISSINAWAMNFNKLALVFTDKEPVLWIFSYYNGGGKGSRYHSYQVDIIDPKNRKLLKRIPFEQTSSITASSDMSDFTLLDKQFFSANKSLGIQWRDAYTGDILADEKSFSQRFKELQAGIGEISKQSHDWYEITTKDGLKFWYYPPMDYLISEEEKKKNEDSFNQNPLDLKRKDIKLDYVWGLSNGVRKELYLVKQYHSIYQSIYPHDLKNFAEQIKHETENQQSEDLYQKEQEKFYRERYPEHLERERKAMAERKAKYRLEQEQRNLKEQHLVTQVPNRVFLNGKVIYGDSSLCVVMHASEIGKEAQYLLTCVDKSGKIVWELKPNPLKIFQLKEDFTYHVSAQRKGGELAIISNHYQKPGAALLNLKNGQIIWEFMALE